MDKNILIIGGSRGIGYELSILLEKDHNVTVASRTKGRLKDEKIRYFAFDASKDDITKLDLPEKLDGLVYCPGSINLKPLKMLKPENFEEDLQLNFISMVKILQGLMPKLKRSEQASIVLFSTVAVKVGMPFHTSVAASKGAIEGFSRALAAEYAPGVRVNVIAPSLVDTSLAQKLLSSDEKRARMNERHPLQRIGQSRDIANLATFLLSEKSSWMTGQILGLDGGLSTLNIN